MSLRSLVAALATLTLAALPTIGQDAIIPKTATAPVIDGELDLIWKAQPPFDIAFVQSGNVENEDDLSAEWYGLYDDEYYYFFIDVKDQTLESEAGADIWRNDRIEVYFNMDNERPGGNGHHGDNYQYAFHWNKPNEKFVSNNTFDGINWTVVSQSYGYTVEIAMPWTTLFAKTPAGNSNVGYEFGFDIAINDNDGGPLYDSVTYWWNSTGIAEWGNIDGAATIALGELFDGNFAPIITQITEVQTVLEGENLVIDLHATDLNKDDTLAYSADSLPSFVTITSNADGSGVITITPEAGDANIYQFTVTVSDGEREDATEVILIVKDPAVENHSPEFESVDIVHVTQGQSSVATIVAFDRDDISVSISGVGLPSWATVKDHGDNSATLTASPTFSVLPQDYVLTVQASDDAGASSTLDVNVRVTEGVKLTEYYLDPLNGSIDNPGTVESPLPSLQEVTDAGKQFAAGDMIYLLDGYHGEATLSGSHSDYVFVMPAEAASPTLSKLEFASNSSRWHVSGLTIGRSFAPEFHTDTLVTIRGQRHVLSDCMIYSTLDTSDFSQQDWVAKTVRGVHINGSNHLLENNTILYTGHALELSNNTSHCVVRRNRIQHFSGDGIRAQGNDLLFEYNFIADNYNVDDNHDDGFQSWSTGSEGVGSSTVYRITLRGNTIIQTTDPSRKFQGPLQGIGCFDGIYEGWVIENNLVVVNQWHGLSLYGAINCKIINNTVIDQSPSDPGPTWLGIFLHKRYGTETDPVKKADLRGRGNVLKNNIATGLNLVADTIVENENNLRISHLDLGNHFVDYPYGQARLRSTSEAVNAGAADGAPAFDMDGDPRGSDAGVDIGADEYRAWFNFDVGVNQWVDTGSFLGWINIASAPWLYQSPSETWLFAEESWRSDVGAWVYAPSLVPGDATGETWAGHSLTNGWAWTALGYIHIGAAPYGYSHELKTWIYLPEESILEGGSWLYVFDTDN